MHHWSIFEDKNGLVNVRIRFTKCDEDNTNEASFRRISDKQVKRNRQRAIRHQNNRAEARITKSQASEQNLDISTELPRGLEDTFISETVPLDSPVIVEPTPEDYMNTSLVSCDQSHEDIECTSEPLRTDETDTVSDCESANTSIVSKVPQLKAKKYLVSKDQFKRCDRCSTSVTVAKNVHRIKMYYCNRCREYACENCYFGLKMNRRIEKHDRHRDRVKEV